MPISGVEQPSLLPIDATLRLRRFDGRMEFALAWYQDLYTVRMVDGPNAGPYDWEKLRRMYGFLDKQGELYWIDWLKDGNFQPIGDVTFWQADMPIVIGEPACRGAGVGKRVVRALIARGRELGYPELFVREIYHENEPSRRLFESLGFRSCGETELGRRYRLPLLENQT